MFFQRSIFKEGSSRLLPAIEFADGAVHNNRQALHGQNPGAGLCCPRLCCSSAHPETFIASPHPCRGSPLRVSWPWLGGDRPNGVWKSKTMALSFWKPEQTARMRPLNRQLLFSHLSVAVIGLGMLFIALVSTDELRGRITLLASKGVPLAQASMQLLAGVQYSLASLRGWVNLGDPRFLDDWQTAWQKDIQPALDSIELCQPMLEQTCPPERLRELQTLLTDLQESQRQVREVAHTPANQPARIFYRLEIEPKLAQLAARISEPRSGESNPGEPGHNLSAQLTQIHDAFHATHLLLREILGNEGLEYVEKLREQLDVMGSRIAQTAGNPLLGPDQRRSLMEFQREWQVFLKSALELIQRRQAPDWNVALHRMTTETDPLANRVIALATTIAADAQTFLKQETDAAWSASIAMAWNLVLLIVMMVIVAYGMSSAHARVLARPITALAEATHRLAAGRLNEDIPVSGNDELAELTRSFNTMRASLQQAQAELREANALLEQRVGERTTQLAAINQSLSREMEERTQTDHALRDSEARLRAIAYAIPDLVFVVDEDGRYREILARGRDRIAVGSTPIRGKLLSEIHSPDMAKFFLDIIHRALQTRQIQVAEYELTTASGRRWFESRTVPLDVRFAETSPVTTPHPQGDLFGPPELRRFTTQSAAIVIVRDITRRKQAEAQLRQAQKMQAIGQLTGGIAHDFNNLLAIIMGNLELLNEQLTAQPELHELAQQALSATDRGAKLTQRLLAFSRRQPLLAQQTDLNKLVLGMLELMRRTLGANIRIETELANDLEQTLVDQAQLENALLNLVINARDAMPQGGRLTLTTANVPIETDEAARAEVRSGPYVMLAVSDTGVGMTPEVLERAFEPFFTIKEIGKGSGLGLSMVYGLVKQSNGHITIHSEPGQGATVRLYLPQITQPARATAEPRPADISIRGRGEIILVVEDDADVRQFAVSALRGLGYTPLQAADAATALRVLETMPQISLLFTDIVMPGEMDGIQLAAEAQRRYPGLPVLLTSGYTEHAPANNGQPTSGVEILTKPYRKNELKDKLRLLLGQRENP